mmetsp:Transcript_62204/g.110904  ORF Transcript_62204/g.110904 Transcript_62204/m.110904 type:complete len:251 (-) Transcript_62204:14-766(-)
MSLTGIQGWASFSSPTLSDASSNGPSVEPLAIAADRMAMALACSIVFSTSMWASKRVYRSSTIRTRAGSASVAGSTWNTRTPFRIAGNSNPAGSSTSRTSASDAAWALCAASSAASTVMGLFFRDMSSWTRAAATCNSAPDAGERSLTSASTGWSPLEKKTCGSMAVGTSCMHGRSSWSHKEYVRMCSLQRSQRSSGGCSRTLARTSTSRAHPKPLSTTSRVCVNALEGLPSSIRAVGVSTLNEGDGRRP